MENPRAESQGRRRRRVEASPGIGPQKRNVAAYADALMSEKSALIAAAAVLKWHRSRNCASKSKMVVEPWQHPRNAGTMECKAKFTAVILSIGKERHRIEVLNQS